MPHKLMLKYLVIMLVSFFITGCVKSGGNEKLPKDEEAVLYLNMGMRYLEMGMLKEAKNNLEDAQRLDPNNTAIYNNLGALYERLKLFSEAELQYKKAVALDADNAGAKNNYGRFLCERGDYNGGMKLLNEALAMPLNNRKWFAYTNIGRCLLRNNKKYLAEINLRKALQINKSFHPALFEMQKISYHSEKYMSARAFLERYLAVSQHNPETLWYAVQTERALGNLKLAESYKETLNRLFPASKQAQQLNREIN